MTRPQAPAIRRPLWPDDASRRNRLEMTVRVDSIDPPKVRRVFRVVKHCRRYGSQLICGGSHVHLQRSALSAFPQLADGLLKWGAGIWSVPASAKASEGPRFR